MDWFDLSPERLVLEYSRVKAAYPGFKLRKVSGRLRWYGNVEQVPTGIKAAPMRICLIYPGTFPTSALWVEIVSPPLSLELVGHAWHRLNDGDICYVKPARWLVSTTADEIIAKIEDWYFNFLAKQHGLVKEMPDLGRISI